MMKKLLVLMLVLGVASMASAGLTLSVDGLGNPGAITMAPSDTFVLSAEAVAGFGLGDFQISLSNAQGSLDATGATFSQEYVTTYLPSIPLTLYAPWQLAWATVLNLQDDAQHFSLGGGNLPTTVTLYDELVMDGLVFHLGEATEVIITLEEYMGAGVYELRDTLTIVPEPMTLGLLGLGGLFLRRRK